MPTDMGTALATSLFSLRGIKQDTKSQYVPCMGSVENGGVPSYSMDKTPPLLSVKMITFQRWWVIKYRVGKMDGWPSRRWLDMFQLINTEASHIVALCRLRSDLLKNSINSWLQKIHFTVRSSGVPLVHSALFIWNNPHCDYNLHCRLTLGNLNYCSRLRGW